MRAPRRGARRPRAPRRRPRPRRGAGDGGREAVHGRVATAEELSLARHRLRRRRGRDYDGRDGSRAKACRRGVRSRLVVVVAALASPASALAARTASSPARIAPAGRRAWNHRHGARPAERPGVRLEAAITGGRFRLAVPVVIVMVGDTTHGGCARSSATRGSCGCARPRVALRPIKLTRLERLARVRPAAGAAAAAAGRAAATYIVYVRVGTSQQLGSDTALDCDADRRERRLPARDGVAAHPHSMLVIADRGPVRRRGARGDQALAVAAFDPRTRLRFIDHADAPHLGAHARVGARAGRRRRVHPHPSRQARTSSRAPSATRAFGTAPEILARLALTASARAVARRDSTLR